MTLWFFSFLFCVLLAAWILYQATMRPEQFALSVKADSDKNCGKNKKLEQFVDCPSETRTALATEQLSLKDKLLLSGAILLVPLGALGFYNELGSPHLPGRPFEKSIMEVEPKNLGEALVQAQVLSYRNLYDMQALKNLGDLYFANGYWLDAMQSYNRLFAQHGAEIGEKLSTAPQYQALRHFIAANMDLVEERVDKNPQDPQAWGMLIRAYHFLKKEELQRATCARAKNILTQQQMADLTLCSISNP